MKSDALALYCIEPALNTTNDKSLNKEVTKSEQKKEMKRLQRTKWVLQVKIKTLQAPS